MKCFDKYKRFLDHIFMSAPRSKIRFFLFWVLLSFFSLFGFSANSASQDVTSDQRIVQDEIKALSTSKLRSMESILIELENRGEIYLPLFEALLNGQLYLRKSDQKIVKVVLDQKGTLIEEDLFSNDKRPIEFISEYKKIRTNNRLRAQLREIISRLGMRSQDYEKRRSAIANMIGKFQKKDIDLLQELKKREEDQSILEIIKFAIALNEVKNRLILDTRIEALGQISGNLDPLVKNTLNSILKDESHLKNSADNQIFVSRVEAELARIAKKERFYSVLEKLSFGLSLGSILLLAALGLAITFGVMGVINMAHGELIMLGAYTAFVVQSLMPQQIGLALILSIPIAFFVAGCFGALIQYFVIRHLYNRPLESLLATFGISLVLQQLARTIFSPLNRQVLSPDWMTGSLVINPIFSLTYNRLYIFFFALFVFAILQIIIKKTSLGLKVRAVSQNREMAKALGVQTNRIDALTFALGSGVAGLAGVALSQLVNVGPNLGQAYLVDSFLVVVFGGVGNLFGTLVGSFSLGILNKFLEPELGAVLSKVAILVFLILFIQKRPEGLFPQKARTLS